MTAPEEAHQLIDAAGNERDHLFPRLLWETGVRVSEAIRIKLKDVGRDGIRVAGTSPSRGPTRSSSRSLIGPTSSISSTPISPEELGQSHDEPTFQAPLTSTSEETVVFNNPPAGLWYIIVLGFAASSEYVLTNTFQPTAVEAPTYTLTVQVESFTVGALPSTVVEVDMNGNTTATAWYESVPE